MERNGQAERGGAAGRHAPGRMRPGYADVRAGQPCPCGSGRSNVDCHGVREVDYLAPAPAGDRLPQVSTHGLPLASDPASYSSGVATRCHACGVVLTVGIGFGGEEVVVVCDCGARNAAPRAPSGLDE